MKSVVRRRQLSGKSISTGQKLKSNTLQTAMDPYLRIAGLLPKVMPSSECCQTKLILVHR